MKKELPRLADRIRYNGLYKIVAFFVALAIWLTTLHGRKDAILMRNMDVEFVTRPGVVAIPMDDRSLQVRVAGPRAQLKKFTQSGRILTVQLRDVGIGTNTVDLDKADIQLPVGVKLLSVKPETMKVEIRASN